mgnify:CR=1 FL=1
MNNKLIITVLLFVGIISNILAQKVDFSSYLASSGGVHTSTPSVVDKNGNIANILRDVDVETHADDVFNIAVKLN